MAGNEDKIASSLYQNVENQTFVSKFFKIVATHRYKDPFLKGRGPTVSGYNLNKIPFAFMINDKDETVDLVIFNSDFSLFEGLFLDQKLTALYGSNVFIYKNVPKASIATQGEDNSELSNFSYLWGADYFSATISVLTAGKEIPITDSVEFNINPSYMKTNHPLRKALGKTSLALYSPKKDFLFNQFNSSIDEVIWDGLMDRMGGFDFSMLLMMVHETYHMKEGIDTAGGLNGLPYEGNDTFATVSMNIQNQQEVRSLLITYTRIIFAISNALTEKHSETNEKILLSDLTKVISTLRLKHPIVWDFIRNYEYAEGFAEYVAAHSLVESKIISLKKMIEHEQFISPNNLTYRTGALGGLYLSQKLNQMPFHHINKPSKGVWEIILELEKIQSTPSPIEIVIERYTSHPPIDEKTEIDNILDYTDARSE